MDGGGGTLGIGAAGLIGNLARRHETEAASSSNPLEHRARTPACRSISWQTGSKHAAQRPNTLSRNKKSPLVSAGDVFTGQLMTHFRVAVCLRTPTS